jgi:hypothetical protein
MLVPLLITISALVTSPGAASPSIVTDRQQIVGELSPEDRVALVTFDQSVQDYMALHRRLARHTPPLRVTADPVELRRAVDALGEAIRVERSTAQTGEIFTPAVANMFRRRIDHGLWDLDVSELMAEMEEDSEVCVPRPVVNGRFPWSSGNAMWPSVLAVLPELPEELEYRFVGADLVLIDIRANLVVDILESALTPGSQGSSE